MHEKFAKSLKTGFSRLFVRKTTPDIRESRANIKILLYLEHNRDYIFMKAILLAKFVKISSLENYHLYSICMSKLYIGMYYEVHIVMMQKHSVC